MTLIYTKKMRCIGTRAVYRHSKEKGEYLNITAVRRNNLYAPISSEHCLKCSDDYHRRRDVVATLGELFKPAKYGDSLGPF